MTLDQGVTIVPEDAVPIGTFDAVLAAPVVGRVASNAVVPAWWDLAAAAALVLPEAGRTEEASWALEPSQPGRLRKTDAGAARVYRSLEPAMLEAEYLRVLT